MRKSESRNMNNSIICTSFCQMIKTICIVFCFIAIISANYRNEYYHAVSASNMLEQQSCNVYSVSSTETMERDMHCSIKCNEMSCCVNYDYQEERQLCLLCLSKSSKGHQQYEGLTIYNEPIPMAGQLYDKAIIPSGTNCADVWREGKRGSCVYPVIVSGQAVNVYCDMATSGGGWTVFQRRMDGSVSFARNWVQYENGFGNITGEFWLGNLIMSSMTSAPGSYRLRIELEAFDGETRYAEYENFKVGSKANGFMLYIGTYSGTAGDSGKGLSAQNGHQFSTYDMDNDGHPTENCASHSGGLGGFWYDWCHYVNLNGEFTQTSVNGFSGIVWQPWHDYNSLKAVEMKFRPMNFP